jgi:hypothetical protein
MAFHPTMGSSTGDRSRSISEGQARRPRLRQLHQPPPTPAGALRRQMTDSLVDGVQVDLVGRFPACAGDVPGPNAQPGHRGSMAEPVSPGQCPGFDAGGSRRSVLDRHSDDWHGS